eukprot:937702-Pleurochrysis_carterae.AAC.1
MRASCANEAFYLRTQEERLNTTIDAVRHGFNASHRLSERKRDNVRLSTRVHTCRDASMHNVML